MYRVPSSFVDITDSKLTSVILKYDGKVSETIEDVFSEKIGSFDYLGSKEFKLTLKDVELNGKFIIEDNEIVALVFFKNRLVGKYIESKTSKLFCDSDYKQELLIIRSCIKNILKSK